MGKIGSRKVPIFHTVYGIHTIWGISFLFKSNSKSTVNYSVHHKDNWWEVLEPGWDLVWKFSKRKRKSENREEIGKSLIQVGCKKCIGEQKRGKLQKIERKWFQLGFIKTYLCFWESLFLKLIFFWKIGFIKISLFLKIGFKIL